MAGMVGRRRRRGRRRRMGGGMVEDGRDGCGNWMGVEVSTSWETLEINVQMGRVEKES